MEEKLRFAVSMSWGFHAGLEKAPLNVWTKKGAGGFEPLGPQFPNLSKLELE